MYFYINKIRCELNFKGKPFYRNEWRSKWTRHLVTCECPAVVLWIFHLHPTINLLRPTNQFVSCFVMQRAFNVIHLEHFHFKIVNCRNFGRVPVLQPRIFANDEKCLSSDRLTTTSLSFSFVFSVRIIWKEKWRMWWPNRPNQVNAALMRRNKSGWNRRNSQKKTSEKGPEIIRMLNELPVVYIPSNGRQLPAERK